MERVQSLLEVCAMYYEHLQLSNEVYSSMPWLIRVLNSVRF